MKVKARIKPDCLNDPSITGIYLRILDEEYIFTSRDGNNFHGNVNTGCKKYPDYNNYWVYRKSWLDIIEVIEQ